jgi:hypothetical protein
MYSLLIKDRGYPIHIYIQHMKKVRNLTRSEAANYLADYAFNHGLKDTIKLDSEEHNSSLGYNQCDESAGST